MGGQGQLHSISPRPRAGAILLALALFAGGGALQAQINIPGLPAAYTNHILERWSFNDTNNWTSDLGYAPLSFTNLTSDYQGDWTTLILDNPNAAWLQYNGVESDGRTNLTLAQGTVTFWFAADWSSTNQGGTGPGVWGRLLEVGSYTTNASFGWWSIYLDDVGANLYFSAQSNNGSQTNYIAAPIGWLTNDWHFIALTYSATGSALYLDGELLTNGPPVTVLPSPSILTNGFYIGSDNSGVMQAHGIMDDVVTYDVPLDANAIARVQRLNCVNFWCNPYNRPEQPIGSAPAGSSPAVSTPIFNAVTGSGYAVWGGVDSACVTGTNVWIKNVNSATNAGNGTMNVTLTITGGTPGYWYDFFATSALVPSPASNGEWAWLGQGTNCGIYTLTNLPNTAAFILLGTPQDTDQDGLTDAYELLVSHTDPNNPDTSNDGMLDGWKKLWGLSLTGDNTEQPTQRSNYGYNATDWLNAITGVRGEVFGLDFEGNVQSAH